MRPFLFAALAALAIGCAAREPARNDVAADIAPAQVRSSTPDAPRGGRLRPPDTLACDRNHLTSYTGVVSGYRRDARQTWLQISTDEDTVESVSIDHAGQVDASARFLLRREPFGAGDWAKIEKSPGQLHAGMRATAWVCDDGATAPVIDWQPALDE